MNPKLSLVIGIICISFSPIFVKLAGVLPVTATFYRIFIGWLCLAPYCIAKGQLKIGRRELLITIAGGIVFGLDIFIWNLSLARISATVSTLITNLAPVWVGLLSYLLFKKRSGYSFWLGTALAVTGMVVLAGYQHIIALQFGTGIVLAIISSLLYAVFILITKGVLQKTGTLTFMFYNMLAASVFLLIICGYQRTNMIDFSIPVWLYFLGMGLICQLIGWITINGALRFLESTKVSVALLSQTVVAGLLAFVLLNERLERKEIIGSIIVLAGIAITFIKRAAPSNPIAIGSAPVGETSKT
jgi:drug/metabolite transporter (DMT)-like permease